MHHIVLFYIFTTGLFLFPLVWFFTDYRSTKERILWQLGYKRLIRHILIAFILILQYLLIQNYPSITLPGSYLLIVLGIFIYLFGIGLSIWAKIYMKNIWGIPAQHNLKRQHTLLTKGPFSFTRNPIYIGLLLTSIGYFFILRSYLVFVTLIIFYYINRVIIKEEKILHTLFGSKYITYTKIISRYF